MELKEVTKLQKGGKVRISRKAVKELGWQEGELIAQFVNKKDAVVLMRAQDVLSVEEIEGEKY